MNPRSRRPRTGLGWAGWTAFLLAAVLPGSLQAQTAAGAAPQISPGSAIHSGQAGAQGYAKPSAHQRKAAKAYIEATKLFAKGEFEAAMRGYQHAATLDPGNADYPLAVVVARNHAVAALIQAAAKDRVRGDAAAASAALAHALQLDPGNAEVAQHLGQMGDAALSEHSPPLYEEGVESAGGELQLAPGAGPRSFHLRTNQREIIMEVFKSYGLEATVDDSVPAILGRLDVDRVDFAAAARILGLVTNTFYVPLDAHRVLVAQDTRENRERFMPQGFETVYLTGLTAEQMTGMIAMAKDIFNVREATADTAAGTISLRAPQQTLDAFNTTVQNLLAGRSQILLNVRLIQLAHTSQRNTGVTPLQSVSAFNVYTEEQSLLSANQSLVNQIISSGLASANDPLTILGILAASGQVSSSLFSNGVALFGGGLTQSALSLGGATMNLNLNSSDTRELDDIQLRLGDGEDATIKSGSRYPIQTASYSSPYSSLSSIAGLTAAGTSSNLSSLLASYSSATNIPQVQYEDLGLTLKVTSPKLMRNGDITLTVDMQIDALSGSSIDGNPILNNRAYSGVVTLQRGEAAVIASEMDKNESLAVSGSPGISEIPGMSDLSDNNNQKNYATLLLIMTAHVLRGTQTAGHSPMMRVARGQEGQF